MLKGISIQNFKGTLQCNIADFNEINVFVGEAGSGKSTVLDAIYLLKIPTEKSDCLTRIMSRRTRRAVDLSSLWYNYETDHQVLVRYMLGESSFEFQLFEKDDGARLHVGQVECSVQWNGRLSILQELPSVPEERYAANITLLDNQTLASVSDIESKVLDPMKQKQLDHKMIDVLTKAFPTCKDYGFRSASPRQQKDFRCYLDFGNSRVLIDDISDGLRNGLAILSTACMLTDSALLLEEPENNIYPKALDRLLDALVYVCKSNRVQLFVTTHRPEVLASFVEYGKERATVFHFSRTNGEVRARPSQWNDTRILLDIGWDIGKLAKGYEKLVIVEGDRDKLTLEESFRKVKGVLPESLWITIIPARGLDKNVTVVLKAVLPTEREIFVLPDLDKKSADQRREQLIQSVEQLKSEGYEISQKDNVMTISKGSTRAHLKTENILPLGNPEGLRKEGFNFQSFSMDDYLLETILSNPRVWNSLEITQEVIEKGKRCKDAKSVVQDIMKMDDERTRLLVKNSVLSNSLTQIINAITEESTVS